MRMDSLSDSGKMMYTTVNIVGGRSVYFHGWRYASTGAPVPLADHRNEPCPTDCGNTGGRAMATAGLRTHINIRRR